MSVETESGYGKISLIPPFVQFWCSFRMLLAPSMFAGDVGGSNPLPLICRCPSGVPSPSKPLLALSGEGFDSLRRLSLYCELSFVGEATG